MAMSADKKKALASAMGGINKKFGLGTVSIASDIIEQLKIQFYKTPSHEFNIMLGGGVGKGKIVEFFGESGSGKTSMAMETIAYNQKADPEFLAGWFETEGSFDPDYAVNTLGIDMDRCVYWDQKDTGAEKGLDVLRSLVASGQFNFICVNSVAGLTPKKEIEDEMEKANIALQARMMSKLMRVICGIASKNGTTLIFINQMRTDVGKMFGDPATTTGGKALAFYASQRTKFSKYKIMAGDPINEDDGIKIVTKTVKNRMAKGNPFKTCSYYAMYGKGINTAIELPEILERYEILAKNGAWWSWQEKVLEKGVAKLQVKTIQGRAVAGDSLSPMVAKWGSKNKLLDFMEINPEFVKEMEDLINAQLNSGVSKALSMSAEEIAVAENINKDVEAFDENVEDIDLENVVNE